MNKCGHNQAILLAIFLTLNSLAGRGGQPDLFIVMFHFYYAGWNNDHISYIEHIQSSAVQCSILHWLTLHCSVIKIKKIKVE